MDAPVLAIDDLTIALPPGADRALAVDNVSLAIHAGQTLCVVGESGSGKSVLATTVMGLLGKGLSVQQGTIRLAQWTLIDHGLVLPQKNWRSLRGTQMGMVFQEPTTALNPVMSCGEQLDELLRVHTSLSRTERRTRVLDMFEQVRLPDARHMYEIYPHQLSGGQRQRVVIAMAMVLKPQLLICDEPTTALDVTTQAEILRLIGQLQHEQGSAVLFITHDMGVVSRIANDVLVMHEGRVVEQGAAARTLTHPTQHYTQMLLASVPSMVPAAPRERSSARGPAVLRAQNVCKTYARAGWRRQERMRAALSDACLSLEHGQTIGVVGESGSGKSTLARCLVRLIEPGSGRIFWGEHSVEHLSEPRLRPLRSRVQIIFQDPNRSLNPRRTVGQSLVEGAINFGMSAREAHDLAEQLMDRVRLPRNALVRYPNQFSGGQRQRLAIARALACRPGVLIADEAVSALDVSVQAQILELFRSLQDELGIALLFITHDLRVAAQLCDRVIVMHEGRIVEEGPTGPLFAMPQHDYTRRLLAAAPHLEPWRPPAQVQSDSVSEHALEP